MVVQAAVGCTNAPRVIPLPTALPPLSTSTTVVPAGESPINAISPRPVPGNGISQLPGISKDGRWIVFNSNDSRLIGEDTNNQIFAYETLTGHVELVSVSGSE